MKFMYENYLNFQSYTQGKHSAYPRIAPPSADAVKLYWQYVVVSKAILRELHDVS